jgi:hypothetical protein
MKTSMIAMAAAAAGLLAIAPAQAQTRAEQQRWDQAQRRFDSEQRLYERERQRYEDAMRRDRYRYDSRYDDPYVSDYDAARYYRDDPRYQERVLTSDDHVYRGSDGRYYCRRSDGTTGLVIGAGAGALIGRAIDGGRNRAGGTIVGGVLGALLGRTVEQQSSEVRCR